MINIILKSLKDIFSPTVIGFILKITLSAFVLMVIIFWLIWDSFSALVASLVSYIPYIGSISAVQTGASVVVAPILAYGLIVAVISLLTSLYSPKLLIKLGRKNYGIEGKDNSKISEVIKVNLKAFLIFFILLILTLPLQFIPVVGQIVMLFLWAVLLKEPTLYDVKSIFNIEKEGTSKSIWIIALIAATFNYIPFINLFAPIFAQIMFMHYLLQK